MIARNLILLIYKLWVDYIDRNIYYVISFNIYIWEITNIFALFIRTRKGMIITLSVCCALLIIFIVYLIILYCDDQKLLKEKGKPDFNTLAAGALQNDIFVHGNIDMILGAYAEENDRGDTDIYYILPIYHYDDYAYLVVDYFISYRATSNFDVLDEIICNNFTLQNNTYTSKTNLYLKNAKLKNLPDKYISVLDEFIENPEFYYGGTMVDWCAQLNLLGTRDQEEIRSKFLPFVISETTSKGANIAIIWGFVGFTLLISFVLLYFIFKKGPIRGFE